MTEPSSRDRMIQSATLLMGEQGVEATSFSQVLERSGAPRGSIYHHFPEGKAQLVVEATRHGGDWIADALRAAAGSDSPTAGLDAVATFWRGALTQTAFGVGCPIVAATIDGDRTPGTRAAAQAVFERWQALHVGVLVGAGIPSDRARALAPILVAGVEGAIVLARAEQSLEPFERVIEQLRALVAAAPRG